MHARGEVGDAEMHRLEAATGLRNHLDVRHSQSRFDQDLDPDAMGDAASGFDLREQGVHEIHVGRDADLRDEHDVQLVPGLLHDVHDVAIHVVRVDAVDAHRDRLAASLPIVLEQSRDDVFPGLLLVGRRDGVLEVEKDIVRFAVERLLEQRRLRAGNRELAPLESWMRRLVAGEAHARTAARGGDAAGDGLAPGPCCASGDCPAAARGASGAAVLR